MCLQALTCLNEGGSRALSPLTVPSRPPTYTHSCYWSTEGLQHLVRSDGGSVTGVGAMNARVLVVDGHPITRWGTGRLLEQAEDLVVVGETGSATEAVKLAAALLPDV